MRQESAPSAYRADSAPSPYRMDSSAAPGRRPAPPAAGAPQPPPQAPPGYPPGYPAAGYPPQPKAPPPYVPPPNYAPPGYQQPSQPIARPGYQPPGYPPQGAAPPGPSPYAADSQASPYRMDSQPAYGIEQPGMGEEAQDVSAFRQPSEPLLPDNYQVDSFDLRVDPSDEAVGTDEGPSAWQSPADVGVGGGPAPEPEAAGRPRPSRRITRDDAGSDEPDTAVMLVRVLLAVGALGGAVVAFVNAGAVGSIAYAFGGLLACFAVWGVVTFRAAASWAQVGIELAVVVAIGATAFIVKPQIFTADKGAATAGTTPGGGGPGVVDVGEPALPDTPLGDFAGLSLTYLEGVQFLLALEGPAPYAAWDNITAKLGAWSDIPSKHSELGADDQAAAFDTWDAVKALQEQVEPALRKHKRPSADGFKFDASPELASDLAAKLRVASDAAKSLEQTIQVYPGGQPAGE